MNKTLLAILFILLLAIVPLALSWIVQPAAIVEPTPTVGMAVPSDYSSHPHGALASSTKAFNTKISPGGLFRVGYDTSDIVRLVIPTDHRFSTPDGISASSTLADVQAVAAAPPIPDKNFGYTVLLPSGWTAHFGVGNNSLMQSSRVESVFAR